MNYKTMLAKVLGEKELMERMYRLLKTMKACSIN